MRGGASFAGIPLPIQNTGALLVSGRRQSPSLAPPAAAMKKILSFARRKRGASPGKGSLSCGGYELSERELSKLHRAALSGDLPRLRELCGKGSVSVRDKESRTPLHLGCVNGHSEIVTYLVDKNCDLNISDRDGRSPLMKAVQCKQECCATILLEHGADTNIMDINGNTALHLAALIPAVSLATQLIEYGANVKEQNKDGCTALLIAVTENHHEMVEFLLNKEADINARDKSNRTSLMVAASNGQISLVKLLLQNDADISIKDNEGFTAEHYATTNEHHACAHLINEHGPKTNSKTSPAHHGASKIKGLSMLSSPDQVIDNGFALAGPAVDREEIQQSPRQTTRTSDSGKDDISQAESESRISNEDGSSASWPPSDVEEEPELSPKKSQKPSLALLMNASIQTKKTAPETPSVAKSYPIAIAEHSQSVSEEDLYHDSDEEELHSCSLINPLPHVQSSPHPAFVSPGSLPQSTQMASTPSLTSKKEEPKEKDDRDTSEDSVKHPMPLRILDPPTQDMLSNVGTSADRKVLMSELGLDNDDADSQWDSEPSSESHRKRATSPLPSPAANAQKQSISEEQSEDLSVKHAVQEIKTTLAVSETRNVSKQFIESVKNQKSDLMDDFGLDDADDIEDLSDWDSTNTSPKYVPHKDVFQVFKLDENSLQKSPPPQKRDNLVPEAAEVEFPTIPATSKDMANALADSSGFQAVKERGSEDHLYSLETDNVPLEQNTPLKRTPKGEKEPPLGMSSEEMKVDVSNPKNVQEEQEVLNISHMEASERILRTDAPREANGRSIKREKVEEEKLKSPQSQKFDETEKVNLRGDGDNIDVHNMKLCNKNQQLKENTTLKVNTYSKNGREIIQSTTNISTKEKSKAVHSLFKGKIVDSDGENLKNAKKNQTKRSSKQTTAKSFNQQHVSSVNGNSLKVFDDSTLSETSQDEGRPNAKSGMKKDKVIRQVDLADDLEDLTLSSDTATEDCDSPASAYRNAMSLIEQLSVEGHDSVNLLKIQNMIHEYERLIERENGRYGLLLGKVKKLENEKKDLQKVIVETRDLKSILQHQKVEWESDLNSVRFTLKQEEEKRKSVEMLYDKSRDQLRNKEDQCCKEMELKQQLEISLRNMELELRTFRNNLKQVEEERNEAQRSLSQERSARVRQEGILNNHLWRQKEEDENKKMITKREESLAQMPEIDDGEKVLALRNHSLQEEINVLKLELERVRARNQEAEGRTVQENDVLKEKLEDLRSDLKLSEEALTQTVYQYNALKAESTMMSSKIEHEKQIKERLETELESLHSRLASAIQELERSQATKSDTERAFQRERDDWLRSQDKLNYDISNIREANSNLSQQLTKTEAKANSLENELHRTTLSLREKTLLLESSQRDLNQTQCRVKELEHTRQIEKDQISKCTVKQESMQEKLSQIQSENMLLRQQMEDMQNKGILKEKAVNDTQDRFSDIFSKLRTDTERQVQMVEERNRELITKNNDLRDEIYKHETEKVEREGAVRQLQQELADALKKLSMSEASLEVTTRYRIDLEEEKLHLQKEIERFRSKMQEFEDKYIQSECRIHELKTMLDDKERELITASQKLNEFSTVSSGTQKTVKQLEEHVQTLEIENARLEATTKQQGGRIEMLQKELQESVSVRTHLEDLITSLQSTKISLEEQLNQEVHQQTVLSQTAKDSHNLWEEELKSRSRLGVRLAQLDREKAELTDQFESERKKVKKVLELKRSLETRFDQEIKRNCELKKEANGMKKLLKTAKKKLKEYESGELGSQLGNLQGGLKNKHFEAEHPVSRLKAKIDELSHNLEAESNKCTQLESTNRDLREQLSSVNILHKSHERLEKSKRQLEEEVANLKRHVETNMTDHNQMGQYKREIEERARQEIRQKLEEVNMFLQTQAASQETLEQIRATNDASLRNQMEHRIRDLESELNRMKNTQQEGMCIKESTQAELDRYMTLYSEEIKIRKSLADKLDRANERLAEANAKLLNERQKSKTLIASSFVNGSLSARPFLDTSHLGSNLALNRSLGLGGNFFSPIGSGTSSNNRVETYLAKVQLELEKNITKELDQANAELESGSVRMSPVGSNAASVRNITGAQDPVSRATQQYLEVLKKNNNI